MDDAAWGDLEHYIRMAQSILDRASEEHRISIGALMHDGDEGYESILVDRLYKDATRLGRSMKELEAWLSQTLERRRPPGGPARDGSLDQVNATMRAPFKPHRGGLKIPRRRRPHSL